MWRTEQVTSELTCTVFRWKDVVPSPPNGGSICVRRIHAGANSCWFDFIHSSLFTYGHFKHAQPHPKDIGPVSWNYLPSTLRLSFIQLRILHALMRFTLMTFQTDE